MHADNFATDSLQNVLFPLLQSHANDSRSSRSSFSTYLSTTSITIVSHAFKRSRFLDLHFPALGFPKEWIEKRVRYIGLDPFKDAEGLKMIEKGERKACEAWRLQGLGGRGELAEKRTKRGWTEEKAEEFLSGIESAFSEREMVTVRKVVEGRSSEGLASLISDEGVQQSCGSDEYNSKN